MSRRSKAILLTLVFASIAALVAALFRLAPADARAESSVARARGSAVAGDDGRNPALDFVRLAEEARSFAPAPALAEERDLFDSRDDASVASESDTDLLVVRDSDGRPSEGYHRAHYPSGELESEGRFHDGLREGFWIEWSERGVKLSEGNYRRGRAVGFWTAWHDNGVLRAEAYCDDGKFDGRCSFWNEHGDLDVARSGDYRVGRRITDEAR
jgi:hypothetical protein